MKKKIFISLLALIYNLISNAQAKISITEACSYYGEKASASVYTFASDNEALNALKKITEAAGLELNFNIMAANVPNAAAVIFNNERYILYNQTFMYNINQRINYWASLSILAHEVGHHLNGHSLKSGGSRPDLEIQADKFSGFILAKLGASLQEAQSAINAVVMSEIGSATHPGKSARLAAIANGWYQNTSERKNVVNNNLVPRPSKLFGGTVDDVDIQQVFLTKNTVGKISLLAEKGYKFRDDEFKIINLTDDLYLFWFPEYLSYGYLTDFSSLNMNTPTQLKYGSAPIIFNGVKLESEYMIVYFPNRNIHIVSYGEVVSDKARYISSKTNYINPAIKNVSGLDDDVYHLYEIPGEGKTRLIRVSKNKIDKAVSTNKTIVSFGSLEK